MNRNHKPPQVDFEDFLEEESFPEELKGEGGSRPTNDDLTRIATEISAKNNYSTRMNSSMLEPSETQNVLVSIPKYLVKEMNYYQAENNVTRRFIITQALKQFGFEVKDIDMYKDGRSKRR